MGVKTLWKRLISQGYKYSREEVQHIHNVWTQTYFGISQYKQLCEKQITNNYKNTIGALSTK